MENTSKYLIITTSTTGERGKLYENVLRSAKRVANFIFNNCEVKSVVIVNHSGKCGWYKVAGKPEKTENHLAKEMI
jgi:carbonic anhydrase